MCGCSWKAGCRLPWAGHSGLTSGPAGVHARAPAVRGRETHPLQPPHTGILPAPGRGELEVRGACNGSRCERSRPPLRAGLVWGKGGEGSPAPSSASYRIPARPRPQGTAAGSHTAAPGGHTAPHTRDVRARRNSRAAGWTAGTGDLEPRAQEVGQPPLWGQSRDQAGGWGLCLSSRGAGGCPAGSPGTGLQWSDRMRSSRPTTPPGPVCPARRI